MNYKGFVHSIESGSAVDGPGMRFLIFLAGCTFRCAYCHNPDTWKSLPGQERSTESLLDEIRPYSPWLKRGGGVTISGGEPLQQSTFVFNLLSQIKKELGLHTAMETQGYFASSLPDSWFNPLDLILLDIKHIDEESHRFLTGGFSLQPTLKTAKRLGDLGKELWIRHVILPGYTDQMEVATRLAEFVASIPTVRRVELLPFHQLGKDKWNSLKMNYPFEDVPPPSPTLVEQLRQPFRERGIETT